MNENTKLEIAVEIMAAKIARVAIKKNGIVDDELNTLLEEKNKMYQYDEEVINKILNVYAEEVNRGEGA